MSKGATPPHTAQRLLSTIRSDVFLSSIHDTLSQYSPSFPVSSRDIQVIDTPSDFYNKMLSEIATAKHRICLSSLYLGTTEMEVALVNAIDQALAKNPKLQVHTLFDKHRGQRIDKDGNSSFLLFANLSKKYPNRVCSALFTPPCALSTEIDEKYVKLSKNNNNSTELAYDPPSMMGRFGMFFRDTLRNNVNGRAKELFAVHHIKAYVFDDNVIMSGANLSDIYFTNRQDRYCQIKNRNLSDYVTSIVVALSFGNPLNTQYTFYRQKEGENAISESIPSFLDHNSTDNTETDDNWFNTVPFKLMNNSEAEQIKTLHKLLNPSLINSIFIEKQTNQNKINQKHPNTTQNEPDMMIYPSIQISSFGIRHDEFVMTNVLENLCMASLPSEKTKSNFTGLEMYVATGYFNLSQIFISTFADIAHRYQDYAKTHFDYNNHYKNEVLPYISGQESPVFKQNEYHTPQFSAAIIAGSRQANGWWNAKGITSIVPDVYKQLLDTFNKKSRIFWNRSLHDLKSEANQDVPIPVVDITGLEYFRENWSYHAKGFFVQPKRYANEDGDVKCDENSSMMKTYLKQGKPLFTTVGSSNYGYRSLNLDSELQLGLLIPSKQQREMITQSTDKSGNADLITAMNHDLNNSMAYSELKPPLKATEADFKAHLLKPIMKYFL